MKFDRDTIDTVWLDLDDTIWDFSNNSLIALASLYQTEGLDRYFCTVGQWQKRYLEINHSLWPLYNSGKITKEYLMTERFRRVLANASYPEQDMEETVKRLDHEYLYRLGQLPHLVPGARDLIDYLKGKGYRIGIISNGFKEVQSRKMQSAGITHLIDVTVLSDDINVNKPDRRIFDHALRKASTTAGRSVIIGDNPDTDIAGALAAGWHAIYFNRDSVDTTNRPGVFTISSLIQAKDIL